jgi:TatD DNase family protein
MMIDTHAHIQFDAYKNDRDEVIERCSQAGLVLNIIGTQKDTSKDAVEMAEKYTNMYASIGTHPTHLHATYVDEEETSSLSREESFDEVYYEELVKSSKVIAIGECGLDLYHLPENISKEKVLEKQIEVFIAHANFAQKHDLPLVIHCRNAHDEMLDVLKSFGRQIRGTVHCYTGDWIHAQQYLELGLHLGFTGVVTFPPKKLDPKPQLDLLEVIEKMPLDRILAETDAPYLAPQAYRGTRAEPWMVVEVVKKIALMRRVSVEKMNEILIENSLRLFDRIKV